MGEVVLGVLAVLLIVVAALLSGCDAAISRMSRVISDELLREGRRGAASLHRVVADPARFLGPSLLVRVAAEVGAAATLTVLLAHHLGTGFATVGVATAILGLAGFVVVDVGPRTLGRQQAVPFALACAGVVVGIARLLGPLPRLLVLVGNALTPGRGYRDGPFASEAELRDLVDQAEASGLVPSREASMISGVFELGDTLAREVMVPRPDIVSIEATKTVQQAVSLALRSGFSRIPVTGTSTDDVLGICYLKDLARRSLTTGRGAAAARATPVGDVVRPAVFVPDSKAVDELLREMQAQRSHMVVVVDEYGGTAGLVTIEDILEEIVGEITDEYDVESAPVTELPGGALRVSARVIVEELAGRLGVDLPHDESVETVGGLLAAQLGRVPIPGASAEVAGLRLTAESTAGRRNRIGTVLVERIEEAA